MFTKHFKSTSEAYNGAGAITSNDFPEAPVVEFNRDAPNTVSVIDIFGTIVF